MFNKKIEVMIFGDNLQKIKIRKVRIVTILITFILFVAVSIYSFFAFDIYSSLIHNWETLKRVDEKIASTKGEIQNLNTKFDKIEQKIAKIDSINKEIDQYDKVLIPDFTDSFNGYTRKKNFNASVVDDKFIDSLLHKSQEQLKEFAYLTNDFNKHSQEIKNYPSKYPVKEIIVIRKFKKYKDPMTGTIKSHNGIDFAGEKGADVIATAEGVVSQTGFDKYFGNYVEIAHSDSISSFYSHLDVASVDVSEKVGKGKKIGTIGNSGISTSNHLHFEIRIKDIPVDPFDYIVPNE